MSFPIVPCERCSGVYETGADEVNRLILKNPDIECFKEVCESIPGYHLRNGGQYGCNALMTAAQHGTIKVIEYIVQVGGKELLEFGNVNGVTPLMAAAYSSQNKAIEKLIELGAYVNRATVKKGNFIPANATPLWAVTSFGIEYNRSLTRPLLKNGALLSPMPVEGEPEALKKMRAEIEEERKAIVDPVIQFTKLPRELAHLIMRYAESNN